jgi:hypothetical protein
MGRDAGEFEVRNNFPIASVFLAMQESSGKRIGEKVLDV